ncbi:MAG: hypothetical protein JWO17_1781 [Actinomycetia bacterium]|nr:hypothetical protein [Actinomycetes bacterium]
MRKLTFAAVVLVALVSASYAVANGIEGAKSAKAVAGTFSATGTSTSSKTCTTTDGKTIVVTDGKYTGVAAGDADLAGAITLRARSVINTTDNVGTVDGRFSIAVANGKNTDGTYSAVYDKGAISGLASGKAHQSNSKLLANLSATFSAASGFSGGKLGGATAGGSAVELSTGGCKSSGSSSTEKSSAHGTISALSTSSITVAGLTCAIPSAASADVNAKYKVNDTATINCSVVSGANTLTKIEAKKGK